MRRLDAALVGGSEVWASHRTPTVPCSIWQNAT